MRTARLFPHFASCVVAILSFSLWYLHRVYIQSVQLATTSRAHELLNRTALATGQCFRYIARRNRSLPLCSGFSDLKFAERWRRGRDPRGGSHAQPTSSIVPIVPIVPSGLSPGLSETAAPALWSTRARAAGRVSRLGARRG